MTTAQEAIYATLARWPGLTAAEAAELAGGQHQLSCAAAIRDLVQAGLVEPLGVRTCRETRTPARVWRTT